MPLTSCHCCQKVSIIRFWVLFASINVSEVKSIALFSRLVPPTFDHFPSFIFFKSSQDLSTNPIPSLLDVTQQATKPRTLV